MQLTTFILTFFLYTIFPFPQKNQKDWKKIKTIDKSVNSISTDRLGNLYLVSPNQIWLYNNQGDSIGAFNSRRYGEISYLDTTDPYKILVFFKGYSIILFLDNYLSENGDPIDLQQLDFDQVTIACLSREGGFWLFDRRRQKAYHLDENFRITHETLNLSQWFGKTVEPTNMLEYNNQLFISDPSGILVFDHFGTYLKKISIKNIDHFQLSQQRISYLDSTDFCEYDFKSFEIKCEPMEADNLLDARVEKNRFYTLTKKSVHIYRTN